MVQIPREENKDSRHTDVCRLRKWRHRLLLGTELIISNVVSLESFLFFQADSGGPLMIKSDGSNQAVLVGVVSTGIGCARPYLPGLYTRVSEYIPWIKSVVT